MLSLSCRDSQGRKPKLQEEETGPEVRERGEGAWGSPAESISWCQGTDGVSSAAACLPLCSWHPQASWPLVLSQHQPKSARLCHGQRKATASLILPKSAAGGTVCSAHVASCQHEFSWSEYLQNHSGLYSHVVCWLLHTTMSANPKVIT